MALQRSAATAGPSWKFVAILELVALWAGPFAFLAAWETTDGGAFSVVIFVVAIAAGIGLYGLTALALEGRIRGSSLWRLPRAARPREFIVPIALGAIVLLLLVVNTDTASPLAGSVAFIVFLTARILIAPTPKPTETPTMANRRVPRRALVAGVLLATLVGCTASVTPLPPTRYHYLHRSLDSAQYVYLEEPLLVGRVLTGTLAPIDSAQLAPDGSFIVVVAHRTACQAFWSADAVTTSPGTIELSVRVGPRPCLAADPGADRVAAVRIPLQPLLNPPTATTHFYDPVTGSVIVSGTYLDGPY